MILCGTQCDLRDDVKVLIELAKYREKPVTQYDAKRTANDIGALRYLECSALTQLNMKEVFDAAILAAMDTRGLIQKHSNGGKYVTKDSRDDHEALAGKTWKQFCCFTTTE